jgi:hypothetical protein
MSLGLLVATWNFPLRSVAVGVSRGGRCCEAIQGGEVLRHRNTITNNAVSGNNYYRLRIP